VGVYYPVAAVTLYLRLDELAYDLPDAVKAAVLGGPTPAGFQYLPDGRWAPVPSSTAPTGPGGDALRQSVVFSTAPNGLRIKRNPKRQADECSFSIRWSDLPVDPRMIRSLGAAGYLGTVDPAVWDDAVRAGISVSAAAARRATRTTPSLLSAETLRFTGFCDEFSVDRGEGGEWVRASCRDHSRDLMDTPVPSAVYRAIDWSKPIAAVVWSLLQSYKGTAGLPLHCVGFDPFDKATAVPRGRAHTGGAAKLRPVRTRGISEETYWDLLTDLTVKSGYVLSADVWQGAGAAGLNRPTGRFVLETPRSIYQRAGAQRTVTEYPSGVSVTEPTFGARSRTYPRTDTVMPAPVVVYGTDIESLSVKRRLGRIKVPGVRLVCVDGKRTLQATYPEKARAVNVSPGGLWAADEVKVYKVTGFTSEDQLRQAAQQAFEDLGRGETEVTFQTRDLASLGGDNSDPDMLDLRPGSPIEIRAAASSRGETVGTSPDITRMSEDQLRAHLSSRGCLADTAASVAAMIKRPALAGLLSPWWYVREVEHEFDADDGYSCKVTAVNYLEVRIQREIKQGSA
jgi:hypothetical protein